jgi:hypothetical protein
MQSSTTAIHLELSYQGECRIGRAVNGSGEREFTGWIGLLAAIDELMGPSPGTHSAAESAGTTAVDHPA